MKSSAFSPGELVVSRKYPDMGYLFRVVEMHPPTARTWNKPTVTVSNVRPLIPIIDPEEARHDKRERRGGLYTYLAEEMQSYHQSTQMRLFL